MIPPRIGRILWRAFLTAAIIACGIRQLFNGNFENVFVCILSILLLDIPYLCERRLGVTLPNALAVIIMLFVFSAEILGEINAFYIKYPLWDTMLHIVNGFLMAAIGFSLIDLFNRSDRFLIKLSPLFAALTAFCFSMTIGVLWEFCEFAADMFLGFDAQKDFFVTTINSVALNTTGQNVPIHVDVQSVIVNGEDWMAKYGGYLDIGLIDTMKDLFVNFIGAVVFSVIGYFYVKKRGNVQFAKRFIPTVNREDNRDSFGNPLPPGDQMNEQVQLHLAAREAVQELEHIKEQRKKTHK